MCSYYFSQLQLHSSVHFHCAFLHEHLPPHPLEVLQPHFTSSVHAFEATGRPLGLCSNSIHSLLDLVTPAELYCFCTKCQLGSKHVYSAATEYLVLVESFPLFYFFDKTALSRHHWHNWHILDCLSCHKSPHRSLKCSHSIVTGVCGWLAM